MLRRSLFVIALTALTLATTTPTASAAAPTGGVSRVLIKKQAHSMSLFTEKNGKEEVIAFYKVAIGPGGLGPKRKEGDMTTPVGRYHITAHQPSQYKTFLRLDYPTAADYRRFHLLKERGDLPASARIGGDIGIHGPPVAFSDDLKASLKETDWTAGCIALNEDEIIEVARLVRDGTIVDIED